MYVCMYACLQAGSRANPNPNPPLQAALGALRPSTGEEEALAHLAHIYMHMYVY